MNAPDRSRDVQVMCDMHPEAFGPPLETNDARRLEFLQSVLVPFLNGTDGGNWGVLCKTDQGGKIPCDVITWRDTMEHFDVMTGSGPCWIANGVVKNPRWIWQAVNPPVPPMPRPNPPADPPPAPVDLSLILARLDTLEKFVASLMDQWPALHGDVEVLLSRMDQRYVTIDMPFRIKVVSLPELVVQRAEAQKQTAAK